MPGATTTTAPAIGPLPADDSIGRVPSGGVTPPSVTAPRPPAAAGDGRTAAPAGGTAVAPITAGRVEMCLQSANYWADRLPQFADRMQRRADAFAIAAALLSVVTGLGIWATMSRSDDWWAQLAVSVLAVAAAAIGIVPKVKNYGETAGRARELSTQYGSLKGRLADALQWMVAGSYDDAFLRQLVNDFEAAKRSKDSLAPYPRAEQAERNAQEPGTL